MGKHLSIKEKLNAENELAENRIKIKELKEKMKQVVGISQKEEIENQLEEIKKRNRKLENHIVHSRRSVHAGKYGINGICYGMFGKKFCDLTKEERTEYNKIMKARQRQRKGNLYDREYYKKYYLTHKEQSKERKRLWSIKNKDKIKEINLKKKLKREEERGYGAYEGSWTFKTFGKRYVDMTEEEKRQRQIVYKKMKSKEMIKSE